jgi:UDP-N-acetylglucosamine--N-acetylmuramyl-(pentapeptide) pyrophosphoryl-undecaprenol N-acetylglucosamine transferase
MNIVLTGGGTAGHVTPNIALLSKLLEDGAEVSYIGSKYGIEKELIRKYKIPFYPISAGKFRRYSSAANFFDVFRVIAGFFKSLYYIKKIKPDIVFSKGGFVSCPVVWAAWICRCRTVIHESDITPGLANRLSIPFAKKVCCAFPETLEHIPKRKAVLSGMPIRSKMLHGDMEKGRSFCNFAGINKPVILITGGSQGAESINKAIRANIDALLEKYSVCHICGKNKVDLKLLNKKGYAQFEYLDYELQDVLALADLVISRAGATTIFELLALKKPNILIPLSRAASRGDQILNAESFKKAGYSMVLEEKNLNAEVLYNKITELITNKNGYIKRMSAFSGQNGIDEVMKTINGVMRRKKNQISNEVSIS